MRGTRIVILAVVAAGALVAMGYYALSALSFPSPYKETTTDPAQYPSALAGWQQTGLVGHFPPVIPNSASGYRLCAYNGGGQTSPFIQLKIQLSPAEIARIQAVARKASGNVTQGEPFMPCYPVIGGTEKSPVSPLPANYITNILISTEGPQPDSWRQSGVSVSPSTNEVIFWASQGRFVKPEPTTNVHN